MEKQLLEESNHCNSELFCRICKPELRRLEFEVNEMKLTNSFMKEYLRVWEMQCKPNSDADQNSPGELSNRGRSSMNTLPASEACSLNSPVTASNVQTYTMCSSNLSPASKAVAYLQKKLTELTQQYRLLAHKYNGMVRRLHDCQDALHCSSKRTCELEKVNFELQMKVKEIMQFRHSCNEETFVQKLGVNLACTSPPARAILQKNPKEGSGQVYVLNTSIPDSDGAVSVDAGTETATFNYQRSNMPMPYTEFYNAKGSPPIGYVNRRGYMHTQQAPITSMPCVNMKAQISNVATPYNHTILPSQPALISDEVCSHHCGVATCESCWNLSSSKFSPTNSLTIVERSTPKEQQSRRRCNIDPLSDHIASPSDHRRLRNRNLKDMDESFSGITKADHRPGPTCPSVDATLPTACSQSYDENGPTAINVPKMISIRANSHVEPHNVSNDQKTHKAMACDAAHVLSPTELHKSCGRRHHTTPIRNDVEKEVKVVALAENVECVAFPQGMYKTEMCNKWVRNMGQYCPYGDKCQFAHGPLELRPVLRHHSYKTILCRMVAAGEPCPYEHRCHFRHVIYPHEADLLALKPIYSSA